MSSEGSAKYSVQVKGEDDWVITTKLFTSATGYADACNFLERAKLWDESREIWFTRDDGRNLVFVMQPIKRSDQGQWIEEAPPSKKV